MTKKMHVVKERQIEYATISDLSEEQFKGIIDKYVDDVWFHDDKGNYQIFHSDFDKFIKWLRRRHMKKEYYQLSKDLVAASKIAKIDYGCIHFEFF